MRDDIDYHVALGLTPECDAEYQRYMRKKYRKETALNVMKVCGVVAALLLYMWLNQSR